MRPATSLGPPAANGTTSVSGRFGKSCAPALAETATKAALRMARAVQLRVARFWSGMKFPWFFEAEEYRARRGPASDERSKPKKLAEARRFPAEPPLRVSASL